MAFNSIEFLIYLLFVIAAYFQLPLRYRWVWLLGASLFFYAYSEPLFLAQILAATIFSYYTALRIEAISDKTIRRRYLIAGLIILTANLAAFKYFPFFSQRVQELLDGFNIGYPSRPLQVIMPIGISFYTFQLIAYLVDVFRGRKAERHIGLFALFVIFFPKVVSGPIERAKNLLPQFHTATTFDQARFAYGFQLILWGAFKKVVVADRISPFVDMIYDKPSMFDGAPTILVTWLYAFQIYFDFSGYTDMALGMAAILGFKLMDNFDRPYLAVSISDFWKRWHISLTSWLTDYLYTPLTRQRKFRIKFYYLVLIGVMITFVVSGIWHGSHWTFVFWGSLHGAYIVISLLTQKYRTQFTGWIGLNRFPALHRVLRIAITFNIVCFSYIFFRANSLSDACYIISHLFTGWSYALYIMETMIMRNSAEFALAIAGIVLVMSIECVKGKVNLDTMKSMRPQHRWYLCYVEALCIVVLGAHYGLRQTFLYVRF